jgi:hypothetical protein
VTTVDKLKMFAWNIVETPCEGELKNNILISTPHGTPSSHHNQAILPHTLTRGLYVGLCFHGIFYLPAPTPTNPTLGAQPILYPNIFKFCTAVTIYTHSPMKMEHTKCSEMLAFEIQTPGKKPGRKHTACKTR